MFREWARGFVMMLVVRAVIALPLFTLWLVIFNPREAPVTFGGIN